MIEFGAPSPNLPITVLQAGPQFSQDGATQLEYGYNIVQDVSYNYGSLQLPPAVPGAMVTLANQNNFASWLVTVYAKNGTTDTINGQPNGTAFDVAVGVVPLFLCSVAGQWFANIQPD